jgi:hypothetical protein
MTTGEPVETYIKNLILNGKNGSNFNIEQVKIIFGKIIPD